MRPGSKYPAAIAIADQIGCYLTEMIGSSIDTNIKRPSVSNSADPSQ